MDDVPPSEVIDDDSVRVQLDQFFLACNSFLGATIAGVVWQQGDRRMIHRCSRPTIAEPRANDPIFSAMLALKEANVFPNILHIEEFQDSVLRNRALPLKTLVSCPIHVPGVEGNGCVYVGTLAEVSLSTRWVDRLQLLSGWAQFIFTVYLLSESQVRLTDALQVSRVQAHTDDMTRVWNRKGILQLLGREVSRTAREKLVVSVLFVDMDNLKVINDSHGHAAGDMAILKVADVLVTELRDSDAVGRYGGDEFLVVLVDPERDRVQLVADRLARALNSAVIEFEGIEIRLGASIGVCTSSSDQPMEPDVMIAFADEAVYAAKKGGRGRVVRYSDVIAGNA